MPTPSTRLAAWTSRWPLAAWTALVLVLVVAGAAPAAAECGNGVFDAGESCDDGNLFDDDCCSATCSLQACATPAQPLVAWQEIGPFTIGGRASALAVDPNDPDRVLLGTPSAGIWRSDDRGATWVALAPWLEVAPVSALAIDPGQGSRYLAGTGILQDSGTVGDAVGTVRTADDGVSWSFQADPMRTAYVGGILVWPGEPDRVLLATDRGLLLSTDGGATLAETLTGDSFTTVLKDPFQADTALASGRVGLYRSLDRGASWTLVAEWPGIDDFEGVGAATAVLAVSQLTPGLLRAAVQDLETFVDTDRIVLLESTDGGASWSELPVPPDLCPVVDLCGFANALAIDPADDARMLLGGDRLFRSLDGGQTWTALDPALRGIHEIHVDAAGAVVAGRFGVATLDIGWQTATLRNAGLPIVAVTSLDAKQDGSGDLLLGTRDAGTVLGSGDPFAWEVVFGADQSSSQARFDPFDPDVLYAGLRRGDFSRSDDGGETFATITSGLDPQQTAVDVAPLAPNPLVEGELFTGRLQLFRSTNRGDDWSIYRPFGAPEVSVIAPSPFDDDRLYFALAKGGTIFKADNIHTDAFPLDPELDARVTAILPSPEAPHTIYVGMTNRSTQRGSLWRTTDFGATWEERGFGKLPAVNDVVRDEYGTLYVATNEGVKRSSSEGLVWSPFDESLSTDFVTKLALQDGKLVAGTRGRGVFEVPAQPLVAIDTIPPGQRLLVDGVLRQGPVYEDWAPGSQHTIEPYLLQTEGTRQSFVSWLDGSPFVNQYTATGGNDFPTVALKVEHKLTTAVSPPEGGALAIDPVSPDGFHPLQSVVQLVAIPAPDHRGAGWSGQTSSVDRLLSAVSMDGPRSVTAHFEPLQVNFRSEPPGLELLVDGAPVATPQLFQWAAGSVRPVEAPETVDLDPGDPMLLVFERWSDYLPRVHDFEMRSETFTADVTAFYIPVAPRITVPAGGVQSVRTLGSQHPRRERMISLRPDPGETLPPAVQWLRGETDAAVVTELALPPQTMVQRIDAWVEGRALEENGGLTGDGRIRRTRLAVANPGAAPVSLDLVLSGPDGVALAGSDDVLEVPPGASRVVMLDQVLGLAPEYAGMLSVDADAPVAMTVFGVTENLRPLDFSDPILFHAFDGSDTGVPQDADAQVLLVPADTEHVLVLLNPDGAASEGMLRLLDATGAPLEGEVDGAAASEVAFALAPGGHRVLRIRFPQAVPGSDAVPHVRLAVEGSAGALPRLRQVSERKIGTTRYGDSVLPWSLPPSQAVTDFDVPVDRGRRESGFVLSNPGGGSVNATVTLVDAQGTAQGDTTVALGPGAQALALVGELFPAAAADLRGRLHVTSPEPLRAVAVSRLVNARGDEILAGFPVLLADGAPDAPHHFAYAVDGDSWTSEWWLGGPGAAAVAVDLELRDAAGQEHFLPMHPPETP